MTSSSGNPDQPVDSPGAPCAGRVGGDAAERAETAQQTVRALAAVRGQLAALEESLCAGRHPRSASTAGLTPSASGGIARSREVVQHLPAWLRRTRGESRWPVAIAIVVAIALQLALPDQLVLQSRRLLPSLECGLLLALIVANPRRFDRESRAQRAASLTLTGLLSVANAWSATLLVLGLVHGREGQDAAPLLASGAAIWLTNIIAFGLWYWQFDRGGPAARAHARHVIPDFQFVQMQTPQLAPPEWEPPSPWSSPVPSTSSNSAASRWSSRTIRLTTAARKGSPARSPLPARKPPPARPSPAAHRSSVSTR